MAPDCLQTGHCKMSLARITASIHRQGGETEHEVPVRTQDPAGHPHVEETLGSRYGGSKEGWRKGERKSRGLQRED